MYELRAELDWHADPRDPPGEDPSPDAAARLEHDDAHACIGKHARRLQPRHAGADDDYVAILCSVNAHSVPEMEELDGDHSQALRHARERLLVIRARRLSDRVLTLARVRRSAATLVASSSLRCLVLCLLSSCGTSQVRDPWRGTPPPYSGVRYDLSGLSQVPHCVANAPWTSGLGALFVTSPAVLVDLPLSFVADTLVLPWDLSSGSDGWQPPPGQLCPSGSQ